MQLEILWENIYTRLFQFDHQWLLPGGICSLPVLSYLIYMRGLHPLAKYPGPLLASLTNGWKAYHVYKLFLKSSSSFINNMDQLCGWARIIIYGMETPSLLFTKAVAQWANPSFMMRLRLSIQISLELRMMM